MNPAIRRDTDDTADDGALESRNVRFITTGEYRRRQGMTLAVASGALSSTAFYNYVTGRFAVLVTPDGDMEAVSI